MCNPFSVCTTFLHIKNLIFCPFISNKLIECKNMSKIETIVNKDNRFLLFNFYFDQRAFWGTEQQKHSCICSWVDHKRNFQPAPIIMVDAGSRYKLGCVKTIRSKWVR